MAADNPRLNRRQFLKLTSAATALAVPSLLGYGLLHDVQGESPPSMSPYASRGILEKWPTDPLEASAILLLINEESENPFGSYLGEILRAEGLNCFQIARLSDLESAPLDWFDLVLLAEGPLNDGQAEILESYVAKGGRLVAMRPDTRLAPLFGLEPVSGSTEEGYLQVAPDHPVGEGVVAETLQFHGIANHYRLAGAQAIAWLASDVDTPADLPAVTLHRYGQGQAALWAFDLARSVAYTRQGDPAWANQERDGFWGIRPTDMFKDWIDLDRLAIPQADEQQRLLVNLLMAMSQGARPLPRLWYFPGAAEAMLIATSDVHQNPAYAVRAVVTRVERYGGHVSFYYLPPLYPDWREIAQKGRWMAASLSLMDEAYHPSPSQVADWRARGHEFSVHPVVENGLETSWEQYWRAFTALGFGPVPPTARTHAILWTGWVETARLQASYGMRMNLDYYHVGPMFRNDKGDWVYGHLTGSGLPMKFVDEHGRILNIYQQLTQLADDHLLNLHWGGQVKLRAEDAVEVSRRLLRSSLDGRYAAIAAIFHADPFAAGEQYAAEEALWMEGTLDYAAANGIPIWSAQDWLHFTELRCGANFEELQWHSAEKRLTFRLASQTDTEVELTVMLPMTYEQANLVEIQLDGKPHEFTERKLGGTSYGWVSVPATDHQVVVTYV